MMRKYDIDISKKAEKNLDRIDKCQAKQITDWLYENIDQSENPRKYGKELKGRMKGLWSYRIGDYRAICRIKDDVFIVLAVKIGHRREVYD